MQSRESKTFGQWVAFFQRESHDSARGGRLTQAALAELLETATGKPIPRNAISLIENDKKKLHPQEDRYLLLALIRVFHEARGLADRSQADMLLRAGGFAALSEEEAREVNEAWARPPEIELPPEIAKLLQPQGKPSVPQMAPNPPHLVVGRENTILALKDLLGIDREGHKAATHQPHIVIQGWPGIGKSTVLSVLAHDLEVAAAFPDGILWVSLNQAPHLLSELGAWGRELGDDNLLRAPDLTEAARQLARLLQNRRMLLCIDDAWMTEHAVPFLSGGSGCAAIVTTRLNDVAEEVTGQAGRIYKLEVLSEADGLSLLHHVAPDVAAKYPEALLELVRALEGLPLALLVAGRLLRAEMNSGLDVGLLLDELKDGARLLEQKAPADRVDLEKETIPTVAVLLRKSTDTLDPDMRRYFAYLGPFVSKPATFDAAAIQAAWQVDDPSPIIRAFVDRGLLEFVPDSGRYQMHALLHTHANALLEAMN